MKLTITTMAKFVAALLTISALQANGENKEAAIQWTENSQLIRVTIADVRNSVTAPLGYVLDLTKKQNLCYEGKDFEALDLIHAGLNRRGIELCDLYSIVTGNGTIVVGPCQQPSVNEEFYTVSLPICQ